MWIYVWSQSELHQVNFFNQEKNLRQGPKNGALQNGGSDDVCSIHYIFYRAIGFKKKLAETSWRSKAMAAQKIAHFTRGGCQNLETEWI